MSLKASISIIQYLEKTNRAVSPNELSLALGKSRVTVHSKLKILVLTGWIEKIGHSPRVFYKIKKKDIIPGFVSNLSSNNIEMLYLPAPKFPYKSPTLYEYKKWCIENGFKVPENVEKFEEYYKKSFAGLE